MGLRFWRHFDYTLLITVILLTAFGVVMIYSANLGSLDPRLQDLWRRQAIFGAIGIGLVILLAVFPRDFHWLGDFWWLVYLLAVALLVLVLFFGQSEIGRVRSWFDLGFIRFQPSFLAMNLLSISVGAVLSRQGRRRSSSAPLFGVPKTSLAAASSDAIGLRSYVASAVMMIVLAGLVFRQPDMGTAAVLAAMWLAMVFESDLGIRYIVATLLVGMVALYPLWKAMDVLEFGYMQERILGFIDPSGNPDVGYQLQQAAIAIGSGGLWGKGLAQGTQSQLRYLPVRHTDFIFAVTAEELGFAGVMLLFLLYLILFYRLLRIILIASDAFGRMIATATLAMILFQAVVNIGMNLRLLPVVGLPLPFVSYGPAALLTMMIGIGLAENVVVRHRKLEF
ncbi:MAG: FtsW/RodA/SpoVE family cell cycle protein [Chloroflexota bacterium]|nr:FtsW/RodA/SpoVE family cell cycle protein [Chloroflexota bacterium]